MCGRFSIVTPVEELRSRFGAEPPQADFAPRYNAAPGQPLPVISMAKPHQIELFRWGLVPHWAKDPKIGNHLINARAETLGEKPAWRDSVKNNRCLVLADGFFEWDKRGERHVPYRIALKRNEPFAFAGLCAKFKDQKGRELETFAIVTTRSNELVAKIHERMPVILAPEDEEKWLSAGLQEAELQRLFEPYPPEDMQAYQIATLVNNPRNDVPEVLARAA